MSQDRLAEEAGAEDEVSLFDTDVARQAWINDYLLPGKDNIQPPPGRIADASEGRRIPAMSFNGWPAEALDFYEGLEADNSKAYWTAHKAIYDEKVLGPMSELLEELALEFGEPKIFRPYRDVRFSKDKSPYKTNISAVIGDGYIQLSAQGLAAGSGMYMMAPDQLARYRQAVASDETGTELELVIAGIERHQVGVHSRDVLKTAPRGYPADHPRVRLLRYKGVVTWKEWPVEPWLGTPAAKQRVAAFLAASQPLCAWLDANVGASTAELARR